VSETQNRKKENRRALKRKNETKKGNGDRSKIKKSRAK
jgi:hypothetical protein